MADELIEVWVSRYALTVGVHKAKGLLATDLRYFKALSPYLFLGPGHWHRDEASARQAAEKMRVAKIASLEKQLAKLRELTF